MFYEVIPGKEAGKIETALTYFYDGELESGLIVEIPVGKKHVPGVVLKKVTQPDFQCKEIVKILYSKPLPAHLVATVQWIAKYYQAPITSTLSMVLPNGVMKKRRSKEWRGSQGEFCRTFSSPTSQRLGGGPLPGPSPAHDDIASLGQFVPTSFSPRIQLNPHQKKALEGILRAPGATKLLYGVTGSGKTNIYLKLAEKALLEQKSVILLVPEIALTGQLVQVFNEIFGETITLIHSGQTEAERHLIFEKILNSDAPQIVVGPRSALFAPLDNLGLIIIDEEHESTYYQENSPKYSTIRVASYAARFLHCDCILGSATPTVTDYYVAKRLGSLVRLSEKAKTTAIKPRIQIVDFKNRENFSKNRYFSNDLINAISRNLGKKQQTLIFHNRRGSSPLTICESCGEEILCPNCFLPLTLHADDYRLMCHTCGYNMAVPTICPKCGHPGLVHKGFGTKLLETELKKIFPDARIMRFDADNKKGESLAEAYSSVKDGNVDILVGTQTLAKGLDLPKLATVGVVQADAGLSLPDFASEERVFQLLTQVIGRVGRGHLSTAEVYVQTFRPEHPVLKFAINEDYEGFAEYLLNTRRCGGFPPYKYILKIGITLKTEALVIKKVRELAKQLSLDQRLNVSPPMPAFHERTVRGYTWQIVVRARSRKILIEICDDLDKNYHVTLDPPSLLS